jgi:hypothetical protein
MAVAQDYTAMVIARDAIEGAHTIIFVLAINSGKHHRCATLWARRPFVAGVWKVADMSVLDTAIESPACMR